MEAWLAPAHKCYLRVDQAQSAGTLLHILCHCQQVGMAMQGFQSAPVRLNLHDLNLDRMASGAAASQNSHARKSTAAKDEPSSNGHLEEQPGSFPQAC